MPSRAKTLEYHYSTSNNNKHPISTNKFVCTDRVFIIFSSSLILSLSIKRNVEPQLLHRVVAKPLIRYNY